MNAGEWRFEALDRELGNFLARVDPHFSEPVRQAVTLLSHAVRQGDVCIRLDELAGVEIAPGQSTPDPASWREALLKSDSVGRPGEPCPLILDSGGRLYFQRYFDYEQSLADALTARLQNPPEADFEIPSDGGLLAGLRLSDKQRQAALKALRNRFSIISGGPGTGKTTTIAGLLVLMLAQKPDCRIVLAAPTGKAAARMRESLAQARSRFPTGMLDAVPDEALTLHRLLGYQPGRVTFRHHADNPLPHDVVVVDEASMIDLALMKKLVDAVSPDARLVLLGDRHQLASVEAGAVFGELCRTDADSPLARAAAFLDKSHRFDAARGIGRLAAAVNRGDDQAVAALLRQGAPELTWFRPEQRKGGWGDIVMRHVRERLEAVGSAQTDAEALAALGGFQLLCAHVQGRFGVAGLTATIEGQPGLGGHWYPGKPVLITENHYRTSLFNGDFGVCREDESGALRVVFSDPKGGAPRSFSVARLPAHDTAWAITVHKSQGSEFDHVMLLLPENVSPVVTRELLYTAITRARSGFTLVANEDVLRHAVRHRVRPRSGLAARLAERRSA